MEITKTDLATKLNNWAGRDRKLVVGENGKIDTENASNKLFLKEKASFLYITNKKTTYNVDNETENLKINEDKNKFNLNNINIDELDEESAKKYLKIIVLNPKILLKSAQFIKADYESKLKKIELEEKSNKSFSREIIHDNFSSLLDIYYENRRQIPLNTVDEIIELVINKKQNARAEIIALQDKKIVSEIKDAHKKLKNLMVCKYALKKIKEDNY